MRAFIITAMVMLYSGFSFGEEVSSASFVGDWKVIHVRTDSFTSIKVGTYADDPRYVGRKINISDNKISGFLDVDFQCKYTAENAAAESFDSLLLKTTGERYSDPKIPGAKDFGFNFSGDENVTPVFIKCNEGTFGPKGYKVPNWVTLLNNGQLVTNWIDGSFLVLQRISANEKVSPGFDCKKSSDPTEIAICNNSDLSSWDNSVKTAYEMAISSLSKTDSNSKYSIAKLKSEQLSWIKERNNCNSNISCIKKSMQDRVDALEAIF